jgi:aminoglycoside phosphotransferase (APT) family kinase protein
MADKPPAELRIDEPLVRALVSAQASTVPGARTRELHHVADGWDCSVWRWGSDLAIRLPRRAVAAPLVRHEQETLGGIAARLAPTGLGVPAPIIKGAPDAGYPWAWSIVPWYDGTGGLSVPREARAGWAHRLAAALVALHVEAPPDHPVNPVRGVPLGRRAEAVAARLQSLRGAVSEVILERLGSLWRSALGAPEWQGPPMWIHGDLHPGNIIARGADLVALIDFGDVTAGDPAYDLAVAWLAFDRRGRTDFVAAFDGRHDEATWTRARGWAAAVTLLLLGQSDDDETYAAFAQESARELTDEPGVRGGGDEQGGG